MSKILPKYDMTFWCTALKSVIDGEYESVKLSAVSIEPIVMRVKINVKEKVWLWEILSAGSINGSSDSQAGLCASKNQKGEVTPVSASKKGREVIPYRAWIREILLDGDYPSKHVFFQFGGNPVACVIGLAVLDIIQNEKLIISATSVGKTLLENLQVLKEKHSAVGDVRGLGLCLGIDIVENRNSRKPAMELAQKIMYRLKEQHHILVQTLGPYRNVITITPPMCFTQLNARVLYKALDSVLSELSGNEPVTGKGFLQSKTLLSVEDLHTLDDEDFNGPNAKKPRTSYEDVD
ncbi:ethanolamine-phosphate phospho-lyase-like [Macrobrachium nipponense]|uniref:ethanolamine-phosphate phospho-lyase-like n=1 Tax=Macrobrachium nipponense TaxID=159736 RepID=UPI0030C80C01